jgi:hypothetical protein
VQRLIDVENLYVVPIEPPAFGSMSAAMRAQIDGCLGSIRKTRPHMDAMH